jgi:phospholipid/cholesterol/gamma-HCH transport system substrate-binding protein
MNSDMTRSMLAGVSHGTIARGALAVIALSVALTLLLSGSGTYRVNAEFSQVYGLVEGGRVTAGGLAVGKVKSITLGQDGNPRVTMSVNNDYPIRVDATAKIVAPSVAGETNREIELAPGTGSTMPNGGTIPLSHTTEPQEFDQILSTLDPATRGEVRALLARFDAATAGRGGDIAATLPTSAAALGATADVAHELATDSLALRTLVDAGGRVTSAIESQPGALGAFADRLDGLLTAAAGRQQALQRTLNELPTGLLAGEGALARVDRSIGQLRVLVSEATPGMSELRTVAPDLRQFAAAARPALGQLAGLTHAAPRQLQTIQPLLNTAEPVLTSGSPALNDLIPVANQTRARIPDAFSFFSNWAGAFNDYDANGYGGRVGLVLSSPPTNTIGPSDSGPGRLARPFLRDPGAVGGDPWTDYQNSFVGAGQ